MVAAARVETPPEPPAPRRCLRCHGMLRPVTAWALRCDTCAWLLAYDPRTGLVVPDGYRDAGDLERLREILDRADTGR